MPDIRIRWNVYSTPFGQGAFSVDDSSGDQSGLRDVALPGAKWHSTGQPPFLAAYDEDPLDIYFDRGLQGAAFFESFFGPDNSSEADQLSVDWARLEQRTTPFQLAVLKACFEVTPGETISYGELANRAGFPGSARAAGSVMATNPLPLIIPCHRIVRSDGSVGQYGGGSDMKRALLEIESGLRPEITSDLFAEV